MGKVTEFSADFVYLHLRIRIVYRNDGSRRLVVTIIRDETTTETWSSQMIHWLKAKGFISKN